MAAPTKSSVSSNYAWAARVLVLAGLPPTPNNVQNLVRWQTAEEPTTNWDNNNNPLNINAGGSGSDTFPSLEAAAQETARYLRMPNYTGIYSALATNSPVDVFSAAVVRSPWASGHYGGNPSYFAQMGKPPEVTASGKVLKPGTAGVAQGSYLGKPIGCDPGGGVNLGIGPLSAGHILTGCQVKAITGGLLAGIGGVLLVVGIVYLAAPKVIAASPANVAIDAVTKRLGGAKASSSSKGNSATMPEVSLASAAPAQKAPSAAAQARAAKEATAETDRQEREALFAQMDRANSRPPRPKAPAPASSPRRPTPTRPIPAGSAGASPARKRKAA